MSHFSTVKTELRDREALRDALGDLGHDPREGSLQVRGYRGQLETAELAISQPNGADIGFRLNAASGCYELVTDLDLWKQPVPVERFLALRTILTATAEEGFAVSEQRQGVDGTIELVVTRWS